VQYANRQYVFFASQRLGDKKPRSREYRVLSRAGYVPEYDRYNDIPIAISGWGEMIKYRAVITDSRNHIPARHAALRVLRSFPFYFTDNSARQVSKRLRNEISRPCFM